MRENMHNRQALPKHTANITCDDKSLRLCAYAAEQIKRIGFIKKLTSSKSEACYYNLPGFEGLLRIGAHRFGRTENRGVPEKTISVLTFGKDWYETSVEKTDSYIAAAVGRYIMKQKISILKPYQYEPITITPTMNYNHNNGVQHSMPIINYDTDHLDFFERFNKMCG